jgi:hypothetical protein
MTTINKYLIKKFNEYLSYENTEKSELSDRLMSMAGDKVV